MKKLTREEQKDHKLISALITWSLRMILNWKGPVPAIVQGIGLKKFDILNGKLRDIYRAMHEQG